MQNKATILIVDDVTDNLKLLSEILTNNNYGVRPAEDGQLALASVRAKKPDLVLLDVRMPKIDGFEVCRRLKANPDTASIPVIFVSAFDELADRLKGFELGAVDFITKPYEPKEILARIHTQLEINRLAQELAKKAEEQELINQQLQEKAEEIEVQNEELQCQGEELVVQNEEFQKRNQELSEANAQILASEEKFRTLFETMAQGVVYQDSTGRITEANSAAEKILGLSLDQMLGRCSIDQRWRTIHQDGSVYPGETHPAMIALMTGKPVIGAVMGIYNPVVNTHNWASINAIPQFKADSDQPYQVIVTFEDISDKLKAEIELKAQNDELTRFNSAAIDREMQMVELKKEINQLCAKLGEPEKYSLWFLDIS